MKMKTRLISQLKANLSQNKLTFRARLGELWQTLIAAKAREPEVQVRQTVARVGNTWWNAHNPTTGKSANLHSEQEVRIWLEQSYYG